MSAQKAGENDAAYGGRVAAKLAARIHGVAQAATPASTADPHALKAGLTLAEHYGRKS